jgi:hypothetical protein
MVVLALCRSSKACFIFMISRRDAFIQTYIDLISVEINQTDEKAYERLQDARPKTLRHHNSGERESVNSLRSDRPNLHHRRTPSELKELTQKCMELISLVSALM